MSALGDADPRLARNKPPTARQIEMLTFIVESTATMGTAPTLRDIAARFGIGSTSGVNDHLGLLIKRGLIEKPALKSRAILVTDEGLEAVGLHRCPRCHGRGHVR